ncbi:AhpC/TSA family protein [Arcticibacter pallidicorallinus]|uniref:AhpC/TSA family protein n=2 Tax=Arcticibacter pallidicorallinus TaxID=1259464 RepID=A0A2T0TTB1_9SPHI|nr:AhpC/TSA family protein [Arcticibacter pallidicorallinus]
MPYRFAALETNLLRMKKRRNTVYSLLLSIACLAGIKANAQDRKLKIHIDGVFASKISVLPTVGQNAMKPMHESSLIKGGESVIITLPADQLPGQFILRCNYQENASSNPYPSERSIFVNDQDLEMWVRPKAINNPDSTYFAEGEKENSLFAKFAESNAKQRAQLALLQNFLMGYDQPQSPFFSQGATEYESRRLQYNKWIDSQIKKDHDAFVSNTYTFEYLPPITWKGSEEQRMESLIEHYFDNIDFSNPLLARTAQLRTWTDQYVNIYGARATTIALRDSLFTLAGRRAIEKVKSGHPLLYGWMVDYFYRGYEGFNITAGIRMLEPYLRDPRCLTSRRLEIEKRLKGIESVRPGAIAPDFSLQDQGGKSIQFHDYKKNSAYKLLLFWSADCQHCVELVQQLHPLTLSLPQKQRLEVVAVSLDFTDVEIEKWNSAKYTLTDWKHSHAKGGINSPEASAYFVLATPVMILVDPATNKILALPETIQQLKDALKLK